MPTRSEYIQGEFVLGHIRSTLPAALMPYWRYGLSIIFPVLGLGLYFFNPVLSYDYAKIFAISLAAYIVMLSTQIIRVNLKYRKTIPADNEFARAMPTHILLLAAGTMQYAIYLSISFVNTLGQVPQTPAIPYLVCVAHLTVIFGLNYVWRFVLLRDSKARAERKSH